MSEKLGNYTNYIDSIDVKKDKIDNGINEDRIKSEARKYVESRIKEGINKTELQELLKDIKQLLERQDIEKINLKETLEKEIKKDTKEKLDKEKLVHEAKNTIYEKLGISNNIKSNNPVENFEKGIIDVLIVGNYDLAIEIYNTNGKVLIDALKQLASWEGIKQIAESLKESVIGLFNGNAYDKGKSFAELGLVGTGAFAGLKIAKFGVKGLKHVPKNIPSENIVYNPIVKHTVKETKSKIDGIIPKQELNFEKMIVDDIAKLGDKERIEAGSFYLKKKLDKNQENAIIEAHEVGKDRPGAGVHNYTQEEILQKVRILKETGFSKEERKLLLEKGVCGKEKGIDELEGIKTIDRQNLVEDLPRKDVEIRKITEFPELDSKQFIQIDTELKNIINNVKYNSFEKIEKLFQIYYEKKGNGYSIIDAYNDIDFNHIDINKGSNCVGMAYLLKEKLGDLGINSYLIRFDAGGLINDDYVINGHSALIIPSIINGERHFTLADTGMLISESITFAEGKSSKIHQIGEKKYIIKLDNKDDLPYLLNIESKQNPLYFDPYNEWLNPNETLNKDIMRAIGDYKIVKQESGLNPLNAFITNIEGESIRLKIGNTKKDISYKEFLEIKENKELYELFSGIIKELGENPDDFFNINKEIIEGIGEYKDKIWAPSTKTIIDKK